MPMARELFPSIWPILPGVSVAEAVFATTMFYRMMGIPVVYSILASLGNIVLVGVLGVIIKKIIFNEAVQWRGTTYPLSRYRPTSLEPSINHPSDTHSSALSDPITDG